MAGRDSGAGDPPRRYPRSIPAGLVGKVGGVARIQRERRHRIEIQQRPRTPIPRPIRRHRRTTTVLRVGSAEGPFWHAVVMTEPPFSGNEGGPSYTPPPPQPGYVPPGPQYAPPPPGAYPPPAGGYAGGYVDPAAPWGRHPVTGEPFSEKSKVVGGLLQLLGLFGLVGIGRIYLGYTSLGVIQLVVGLITCGIGAIIWGIVDAILILTDKVRDPEGRPLRDGT